MPAARFFLRFTVLDFGSRKAVGGEVHAAESAGAAAAVLTHAALAEGRVDQSLVQRADNGSPMKGAPPLETRLRLAIAASLLDRLHARDHSGASLEACSKGSDPSSPRWLYPPTLAPNYPRLNACSTRIRAGAE